MSVIHSPNVVLMVRPAQFGSNAETADSNSFQKRPKVSSNGVAQTVLEDVSQKALEEFDAFVNVLIENDVDVVAVDDTATPLKPDAVFPNNWFTHMPDGTLVLFPMLAPNRRLERRDDITALLQHENLPVTDLIDLSAMEDQDIFLEGTGSIVFDHVEKVAYANLSPRTDEALLNEFCQKIGYTPMCFIATDASGQDIYHTNVMLSIGKSYAVICTDAISDNMECAMVLEKLRDSGREIVVITLRQLARFAGNMYEVENDNGERLLIMSTTAYECLTRHQLQQLSQYTRIVHSDISTIEKFGGGSARCMLAGLYRNRD